MATYSTTCKKRPPGARQSALRKLLDQTNRDKAADLAEAQLGDAAHIVGICKERLSHKLPPKLDDKMFKLVATEFLTDPETVPTPLDRIKGDEKRGDALELDFNICAFATYASAQFDSSGMAKYARWEEVSSCESLNKHAPICLRERWEVVICGLHSIDRGLFRQPPQRVLPTTSGAPRAAGASASTTAGGCD